MKLQARTVMTLILLTILLVVQIATAAPQNGRPRKSRGILVPKLVNAQKEKCSLKKNDQHYFQVRMNVTTPEPALRGDVRTRALNPWTYRIDIDHQRFPTHISQAVCAGHCPEFDLEPIEIKQHILVLKKEPSGCAFTMEMMTVVVGCTCVRPATITMDS